MRDFIRRVLQYFPHISFAVVLALGEVALLVKAVGVYLLSFALKEVAAFVTPPEQRAMVYRPPRRADARRNCGVGSLGMPSGHAMLAGFYSVAVVGAPRFRAADKLVLLAALALVLPSRLAGLSAIHVSTSGCHTPLQVAVGLVVGVLCGVVARV